MVSFRRTAAALALAALAGAAGAQEDARPQGLAALSHALGESQALRELCEGVQDQYWRSRMMRLLALEEADGLAGAALTAAFNAGYAQARGLASDCGPDSRRAEVEAAVRGQELAAALAGPPPAPGAETPELPDSVAVAPEPR